MTKQTKRASLWACAVAALAFAACGGASTTTDGGTSGGTTSGGSTGGGSTSGGSSGGSTGAPTTYCDGFKVNAADGGSVYVESYSFGKSLSSCSTSTNPSKMTDGTTLTTLGGILDLDTSDNGSGSPVPAIFPAGCDDLGETVTTSNDGGMNYTMPSGGMTVAAAVAAAGMTPALVGVVTAVYPWSCTATGCTGTKTGTGTIYVQDPVAAGATPANGSGIELYMHEGGSGSINVNYGTAPNRGDVIQVTNLKWSPYKGVNQFAATSTTQVSVIGNAPIPPAVPVTPSDVNTGTSYHGMRVTVTGGPFTVDGSGGSTPDTCPSALTYTPSGG